MGLRNHFQAAIKNLVTLLRHPVMQGLALVVAILTYVFGAESWLKVLLIALLVALAIVAIAKPLFHLVKAGFAALKEQQFDSNAWREDIPGCFMKLAFAGWIAFAFLFILPNLFPSKRITRIVIASFDIRTTTPTTQVDVMQRTYDQLADLSQKKDLSSLHVELIREPIVRTDDDARTLGKQKGADLVIWGWRDDVGAFIRGIRPNDVLLPPAANPAQSEIKLLNPTMVPVCLSEEAPLQGSYLAFFTAATAVFDSSDEKRILLAGELINLALDQYEARGKTRDCGSFNPWNGYVVRGFIFDAEADFAEESGKKIEAITARQSALDAYGTALSLTNNEAVIHAYRAETYSRLGYSLKYRSRIRALAAFQQSVIDYDKYLNTEPNEWYSLWNKSWSQVEIAGLLYEDHDFVAALNTCREAIDSAQKAVNLNPSTTTYNARASHEATIGDFLEGTGNLNEALIARRSAITLYALAIQNLKPDISWGDSVWQAKGYSEYRLALLLQMTGANVESSKYMDIAMASYAESLKSNPNNEAALLQQAVIFENRSEKAQAESNLRHVLSVSKDSANLAAARELLRRLGANN